MPFGFDETIKEYLDNALEQVMAMPTWTAPEYQARLAVLALNLRALANNFLVVDSADGAAPLTLDLKKVALGILGTADFAEAGLPEGIMEY